MAGKLASRKLLITGAASGMGREIAQLFAQEGAALVVLDQNERGVAEVAAEHGAIGYRCDVTDRHAVNEIVAEAGRQLGGLDGLINAAGILDITPFADMDPASWDRMLAVNLTACFLCMKHELAQLITQESGGAIVNTSSGAGLVAAPGLPHYTAAKHGVLGLTKVAASEYNRQNIRVNAVCPGMVDTPMLQSWNGLEQMINFLPGGKLGLPSQVAEAAVWLCSDAADWVSGLSMVVDGGGLNH